MELLKVKFTPDGGYEVKNENIGNGLIIIPTTDGKYLLINLTVDGNFVKIYDDLQELVRKVREYYGDDIAKIVENELGEYEREPEPLQMLTSQL